jgi:hypothetical protein
MAGYFYNQRAGVMLCQSSSNREMGVTHAGEKGSMLHLLACLLFHIDTLVFHGRIAPDRKKILLRWLLLMKW